MTRTAFCAWLTERWRHAASRGLVRDAAVGGGVGESRPRWRANPGGRPGPPRPLRASARAASELNDNPLPRRTYPWGDDFIEPDTVNAEMNVGSTSTPGCFDAGRSPYGCEDMAGNVWEWTRSRYAPYPYRADDGREPAQPEADIGWSCAAVRGATFATIARCAFRVRIRPDFRSGGIGFRVVLRSPPVGSALISGALISETLNAPPLEGVRGRLPPPARSAAFLDFFATSARPASDSFLSRLH